MRRRILFIDPVAPGPYDLTTLREQGLGGTEATVVRIAEELGIDHDVIVAQKNRLSESHEGRYTPLKPGYMSQKWDAIILLRNPASLAFIRGKNKETPLYLWLHDLPSQELLTYAHDIDRTHTTCIAVSDWHRTQVIESLRTQLPTPKVIRIYNPIDDNLQPDNTAVDSSKLIFFSSPHKGLAHALQVFKRLRSFDPSFTLSVLNPGYLSVGLPNEDGVSNLGSLPHRAVMEHLRSSLCALHLNHVFPETMGIVTAEANAVGTPIMAYSLGATPEIVCSQEQIVKADYRTVIDTLLLWKKDRPKVQAKNDYRLKDVATQWIKTLTL